jgi:hypothetical protein
VDAKTLVPGVTAAQASAIEAATLLADPVKHDGLCRAVNVALGATGGPYDDAAVTTAISGALNKYSGVSVSQILFPAP